MPSIAAMAKDLVAHPRPVLCLDTCELLDAVQCLRQDRVEHIAAIFRLYTSYISKPDCVVIVVTELVAHEFGQNIVPVRTMATEFLAAADAQSARIHRAWGYINQSPTTAPSNHAGSALVAELTDMTQRLLGVATMLEKDANSTERAVGRVRAKERPSHDVKIKDSMHLEHYVELSRQLQDQGFQERRVFVSSNKGDFWQPGTPSRVHADLAPQFATVGLEFFGSLSAALGSLRI